jgi:hypothetical protein
LPTLPTRFFQLALTSTFFSARDPATLTLATSKFKELYDKALTVNYLLHAIERNEIIEKRI